MKRIGLYISYILIVLGGFSVLVPGLYIAELVISFLPLMVVMHLFLAGYWLSRLFFDAVWSKYLILLIFHVVGFVYFLIPLYQFYGQSDLTVFDDDSVGISVLYANISKLNTRYDAIVDLIEKSDPDVVMFVEFADHHDDGLKGFLSEHYPYINRTSRSRTLVGSMVFSKYPISNLADTLPQGAWRYGYFSIQAPDNLYYVYLVHTSSPISPVNYRMRNDQLQNLADDIQNHMTDSPAPVLLVGDLNITPWSVFYDRFVDQIPAYTNITTRFAVAFTWRLWWFPIWHAHIDHIFATDPDVVRYIEQVTIPGSDHVGYFFILE